MFKVNFVGEPGTVKMVSKEFEKDGFVDPENPKPDQDVEKRRYVVVPSVPYMFATNPKPP